MPSVKLIITTWDRQCLCLSLKRKKNHQIGNRKRARSRKTSVFSKKAHLHHQECQLIYSKWWQCFSNLWPLIKSQERKVVAISRHLCYQFLRFLPSLNQWIGKKSENWWTKSKMKWRYSSRKSQTIRLSKPWQLLRHSSESWSKRMNLIRKGLFRGLRKSYPTWLNISRKQFKTLRMISMMI